MTATERASSPFRFKPLQPETFGEIIGQQRVTTELRELVIKRNPTRGVILHGPDGVGKHTLARVLAKALLCQEIRHDGLPCGACPACRTSTKDGSFGAVVFDGEGVCDETFAELVVKAPRSNTLVGGLVVIIDRADMIKPSRFDRMLKTLEEPKTNTFFVMLAADVNEIRRAGQSRCAAYRMKPLDDAEARRFVLVLSNLNALTLAPSAIDLILAVGRGLPLELSRGVEAVARWGPVDRSELTAALDLAWPMRIIEHWRGVLGQGRPIEELLGRPAGLPEANGEQNKWPERIRAFLLHFRLQELGTSLLPTGVDPAFDLIDEHALPELSSVWRSRVASQGLSSEEAWTRLCVLAVSDVHELEAAKPVAGLPLVRET